MYIQSLEAHYCKNEYIPSSYHSVKKVYPFFILKFFPHTFFHSVILRWGYIEPTQSVHTEIRHILIMVNMPFMITRILNPNPEYVLHCQGITFFKQLYIICTFHINNHFFASTQASNKIYQTGQDRAY